MTKQGRAILQASIDFGNRETLPFMPCKKGYVPYNTKTGNFQVACPLHNDLRKARLDRENNECRPGEVNVRKIFEHCTNNDSSKYEAQSLTNSKQARNHSLHVQKQHCETNKNKKPKLQM